MWCDLQWKRQRLVALRGTGAGLVIRDRPQGRSLVSMRFHGPNVVSCKVVTHGRRTPIIGAYLPPSTLHQLPDLEESLTRFQDQDTIVLGDLYAKTSQAQNPRSQKVAAMILEFRLMELLRHIHQWWQLGHMKNWSQVRQGRVMRARCDNILGTYRRHFKMVGITGISNYPSYHFALQDMLIICSLEAGHNCSAAGLPAQIVILHRGILEAGI